MPGKMQTKALGLIANSRLAQRFEDAASQRIIRLSDRDPHFHKVVRTGINTPSERPFHSDWWVATNAWTTWKDLWMRLEGYFSDEVSDPKGRTR